MPFKYLAQSFGYTLCVYLFENIPTCIYLFYVYIYMYMYIIISLKANVLSYERISERYMKAFSH